METVEMLAIIEISEIIHKRLEDNRQLTKDEAKELYYLLRDRVNSISKRDEKTLRYLIERYELYIRLGALNICYPIIWTYRNWVNDVMYYSEYCDEKNFQFTDEFDIKFCLSEFKKELSELITSDVSKERSTYKPIDSKLRTMSTSQWSKFYNRVLDY